MIGKATPGGSTVGGGVGGTTGGIGGTTGGTTGGSVTKVERRNQSLGLPETPPRNKS